MDEKDILTVDYKSNQVSFQLTYGYLDKIYEAFNFKTQRQESIEKFVLNLNNENMIDNQYLLLEDMSSQSNNVFNVKLNLDGLEYKGQGKIFKFFGPEGLNIDLHLLEES